MPERLPDRRPPDHAAFAAEVAEAAAAGVELDRLREQCTLTYDTEKHPFLEAVLSCLEMDLGCGQEGLAALRETKPLTRRAGVARGASRGASTEFIQKFLAVKVKDPPAFAKFDAAYLDFIRNVVLPDIDDPKGVCFQRLPTFRCHVAHGGAPTGHVHNDSQYGHSAREINYWVPITTATATNSLHCESAPGRGDFAPFEAGYGECVRFWGSQCVHYTQANEEDITRVSFDFRVLPRSCYCEEAETRSQFVIGKFIAAMTADGVVEARDDCGRRTSLRGEGDAGPNQGEDAGDEWADDYELRTPWNDTVDSL